MTDLETMAATVQGQHDALMVAQGLPTYDRLKRDRDALADALWDTLHICISRGEKLGLDDGGPVIDKARAALAQVRK